MGKPLHCNIEVELAGETFAVRVDLDECIQIEETTNMGLLELLNQLVTPSARLEHVCAVLERGLWDHQAKKLLTPARVRAVLKKAGYLEGVRVAAEILSGLLIEPSAKAPAPVAESAGDA